MTTTHSTRTPLSARRRYVAGVALTGALIALTGCSGSGGGSGATPTPSASTAPHSGAGAGAGASTIVIGNFAFSPARLTVQPGATVTVKNNDSTPHTVTSDGARLFDTGNIAPGKSATFKAPSKAGSYSYICSIHQFMKGSLTVS
ncbi:cupredoxin domain-containing protein [Streptomyces sp. SL13]|uniref:Cupredoxin domain-containing protein n=1 Tax=Streptantibioticus silvisoli TaxID=2705255 RepID=A0AA90HEA3_9ACTN|nr:cupredoxin domain-containing protein [Streptantibioticus silvisoli]MDI5961366.1 cupredoxin domain-containing protein [Streptantibioticus silvisoli]MDI5973312.1 cupredoxin domain-containing protein [Streptantibioticus silvisoli]